MKNLSIRFKILLAFGLVAALMGAAFIYIIISNISIGNNIENMQTEFQLVEIFNELNERSDAVNAGLRVMSLSLDDTPYAGIVSNIDESRNKLSEAEKFIEEHPFLETYLADLKSLEPIIERWSNDIVQINTVNQRIDSIIDEARENQFALTSQSMGIFDYQIELLTEEAGQILEVDARLRRVSRVEQGVDISNRLNKIGSSFEVMFKALDASQVDEDMAFFDETVEVLTEFLEGSALQYNIDTATAMLEALAVYRENIDEFLELLSERTRLIESGNVNAEAVTGLVEKLVERVDDATMLYAEQTVTNTQSTLVIIVIVAVVVLILSVFLALYLANIISSPVKMISAFMIKAGTQGDVSIAPDEMNTFKELATHKDEIGQMIDSTMALAKHLTTISEELKSLAEGDLTIDVHVLSGQDLIGTSVSNLVENLNRIFGDINSATTQVADGSKQVADGAQSLAQGSTEQAASIEQLSSSVTEIASKTVENAEMAEKAAKLAGTIIGNAEKGNQQMDDMMVAVREINEASQNISKVIKTIDDIAFQTNILALNAAVEAARAGQHGKGFAVVAEEVRSLASKSAEAAKDTGELIANSMEKAELGSAIAGDTASSLSEIVAGIKESSELVSKIAQSSNEQSTGITQINTGIDHVAQVVQQNSATAEQSAAASEQMSSQSSMLEELISQFKLKNSGYRSIASATHAQSHKNEPELPSAGTTDTFDSDDYGKY